MRVGGLTFAAGALLACGRPDAAPPAEQAVVSDTLVVASLATDRPSYTRGEAITLTLTVRNVSASPQTLQFSSGQRYDFAIEDTRAPVWRWSAAQSFIQVLGEERLAPGDSLIYREQFRGELPGGRYRAVGWIVRMGPELQATADFEIH